MKRNLIKIIVFFGVMSVWSQIEQRNGIILLTGYVSHTNLGGMHVSLLYQRDIDNDFAWECSVEYAWHVPAFSVQDPITYGNMFHSFYMSLHGLYFPFSKHDKWNFYLGLGVGIIFPYVKWLIAMQQQPETYLYAKHTKIDGMASGLSGFDIKLYRNFYAGGRINLNFAWDGIASYNTLSVYLKYVF